ncbi:IS3 family transposase [Photobacterium sp. BZF1]|uniref:IS3 family transposase n=1 Tax=Photobacterium sp. BZF1 TaxID=1904457 RepID=UPI001653DDF6|nr:IS3 family transposase [Photobacterium sp. BZF1]MBC7001176.1 IS3 family transposase [Photobacterium sp. BZF1]
MKVITRRTYTQEFKVAAVQESIDSPDTVKAVAARLGISHKVLSSWRSELATKKRAPKPVENKGPEQSLKQLEAENRKLRKQLERAELENEIPKKGEGVLRQSAKVKFAYIHRVSTVRRTVKLMCDVLGVSRSGYYKWLNNQPSDRTRYNQGLLAFLRQQIKKHRRIQGYRKLWEEAVAYGYACNKKRVQSLLQQIGYRSNACKRRFGVVRPREVVPTAPNYLNRNFSVEAPDRVWVSDITQIRCHEGWQYLCVIIDLYSRRVVGWATSYMNSAEIVLRALKKAWNARKPEGEALMFHSDRGSQYRCYDVLKWLTRRKVTVSMSRKGNCWDNACSESFFGLMKKEWFSNLEQMSRKEMVAECRNYINGYYNVIRRHGTNGGLSPMMYELEN